MVAVCVVVLIHRCWCACVLRHVSTLCVLYIDPNDSVCSLCAVCVVCTCSPPLSVTPRNAVCTLSQQTPSHPHTHTHPLQNTHRITDITHRDFSVKITTRSTDLLADDQWEHHNFSDDLYYVVMTQQEREELLYKQTSKSRKKTVVLRNIKNPHYVDMGLVEVVERLRGRQDGDFLFSPEVGSVFLWLGGCLLVFVGHGCFGLLLVFSLSCITSSCSSHPPPTPHAPPPHLTHAPPSIPPPRVSHGCASPFVSSPIPASTLAPSCNSGL